MTRQFLSVLIGLIFYGCSSQNYEDITSDDFDYSEIISSGIEGLIPFDIETRRPYLFDQLIFLDHFNDSSAKELKLDFIDSSNFLAKEVRDSVRNGTVSNSEFWQGLRALNLGKEILIQFNEPTIQSDTAQFEYTWQGFLKGSGKSFLITCIKQEGKWKRHSAEFSLAF